jgi:GNAT superfamily N-acetyltransferase
MAYFNYRTYVASSWWEKRTFVHKWWQLQAHDRRWVPPPYARLWQAIGAQPPAHLARCQVLPIYLEALPNRTGGGVAGGYMEEPVAAAVVCLDPRQTDGTAYLALLSCSNDEESLDRLLGAASEEAGHYGYYQLVGPVGLSPWLQSGVLENYFHVTPPLHTPYNPPYLPEVIASSMQPWQETLLWQVPLPAAAPAIATLSPTIQLRPLQPTEEWATFLALWQVACQAIGNYPAPDAPEVAFLQRWLQQWPCWGWVAEAAGTAVGFVLLQPDLSAAVRRAKGGRNWLWSRWLQWRSQRRVAAGRLLYGGVLPAWQGRGIGTLLWQQVLTTAQQQGWQSLTVGPLLPDQPGIEFLQRRGAQPQQRYLTYTNDL